MRGKDWLAMQLGEKKGITPAYAGKSLLSVASFAGNQDHPRLCGEKFSAARIRTIRRGSPPPMRGKAGGKIPNVLQSGITPAYAGKRVVVGIVAILSRDHPRLCGEKGSF